MTTSCPALHDPLMRPELVKSLADYLLQYPHDLIDTKRLLKRFRVSASEFQQALLSSPQEEGGILPSAASASSMRQDIVYKLMAYLRQYPQDLVDTKRLLKRFQISADEFQQALLSVERGNSRA